MCTFISATPVTSVRCPRTSIVKHYNQRNVQWFWLCDCVCVCEFWLQYTVKCLFYYGFWLQCYAGACLSAFFVLYFSVSIPSGVINADVEICPWWVITHSCCLRTNTCDLNKSHILRNGTTWCHGNLYSSGKLREWGQFSANQDSELQRGRWDHLTSSCQ